MTTSNTLQADADADVNNTLSAIDAIRKYHSHSKHRKSAYAPSPGFLDWDSQPDPFRRFSGAPIIRLPLLRGKNPADYETLYKAEALQTQKHCLESISALLELSCGLSAWKDAGGDKWALRHNPSSGNLHPTETYLLFWAEVDDPELTPGVYHYSALEHILERRSSFNQDTIERLRKAAPNSIGAVGFSTIYWREEWKYGERALRYCQLDLGHALACIQYSSALLGWQIETCDNLADADLAQILGLSNIPSTVEPEEAETLAILSLRPKHNSVNKDQQKTICDILKSIEFNWQGNANRLSSERVEWPALKKAKGHIEKIKTDLGQAFTTKSDLFSSADDSKLRDNPAYRTQINAEDLIRNRRSAQRMQLGVGIKKSDFQLALHRTTLFGSDSLASAFPYKPSINFLLFVHGVEGLEQGLYFFKRTHHDIQYFKSLTASKDFLWESTDVSENLYKLVQTEDSRKLASQLSCYQGIAGHSAFSLAMLSDFSSVLSNEGAWAYRRLFWECGYIGQILYLEATASQLDATGIGCFFDDSVHELLGIDPEGEWQDLYHFTVGKARIDERISTLAAYHHLNP